MATAVRPTRKVVPSVDVRFWIDGLERSLRDCQEADEAWGRAIEVIRNSGTPDDAIRQSRAAQDAFVAQLSRLRGGVGVLVTEMRRAVGDV